MIWHFDTYILQKIMYRPFFILENKIQYHMETVEDVGELYNKCFIFFCYFLVY